MKYPKIHFLNGFNLRFPGNAAIIPALILLVVLLTYSADSRFLSSSNILNIFNQWSYLAIFAIAQAFPLLSRGFDLSIGSIVSATSMVCGFTAMSLVHFGPEVAFTAAVLAGIACGVLIGSFNGLMIGFLGLNPFIVTLGTWYIIVGFIAILSGGYSLTLPVGFSSALSSWTLFGLTSAVLYVSLIFLSSWLLLDHSAYGRRLYLLGANRRASHVAGINTKSVLLGTYVLCGGLAAFGAVLLTARTGTAEPSMGSEITLLSIAAAVIGGIKTSGGVGRFYGPFVGALFITILSNALNMLRVDGYVQMMVIGFVIVLAVCNERLK